MKKYLIIPFMLLTLSGCGVTVEKIHSSNPVDFSNRLSGHKTYFLEPEFDFTVQEEGPAQMGWFPNERETVNREGQAKKLKENFTLAFEKVLGDVGLVPDSESYDLHIIYLPNFSISSRLGGTTESTMILVIAGFDVKTKTKVFEASASYNVNHFFTQAVIEQMVRETLSELEYFRSPPRA